MKKMSTSSNSRDSKKIREPSDKSIAINLKGLMKQKNLLKTIIPSLTQKYDYDISQKN